MAIQGTTLEVLDWARYSIPDPKSRVKTVRNEEIGRTTLPTIQRETFYIKQAAIGSVFLYVEPYKYSATASIKNATATDKVFQFNATLQSCTFPSMGDTPIRPPQFKSVLAQYEYTEQIVYAYSDSELLDFLPAAVSYLNNTFGFSYSYTDGTLSTFVASYSTDDDKELQARALAILVRRSYMAEQVKRGYGIRFRGPMAAIDSVQAMKNYEAETKALEQTIVDKAKKAELTTTTGVIDTYTENVVTS